MSLLDMSLLFFFSVILIKIVVEFEKHMNASDEHRSTVRPVPSSAIPNLHHRKVVTRPRPVSKRAA